MNREHGPVVEQLSENKRHLLELEQLGNFVFHGSPAMIESLAPRQAYNSNKETGAMDPDGAPAVFATPYVEVAIFRSLINGDYVEGESTSQFGLNDRGPHFSASQNLLDQAEARVGHIYVLPKNKFGGLEGMQCRSDEEIIPTEIIDVTAQDLPKNIETIE